MWTQLKEKITNCFYKENKTVRLFRLRPGHKYSEFLRGTIYSNTGNFNTITNHLEYSDILSL